jgi:(p)ppGpp synthase/HD superfamily hydrolase
MDTKTQHSKDMERLMQAIFWCKELHANQTDKCGQPYWIHPFTVAMRGFTGYGGTFEISRAIVGLLHDIPEDTRISVAAIAATMRLTFEEQEALELLTHKNGTTYTEYIDSIIESGNRIAMEVKLDDLMHNMNLNRFSDANIALTPKDEKRFKKYEAVFNKLLVKLGGNRC